MLMYKLKKKLKSHKPPSYHSHRYLEVCLEVYSDLGIWSIHSEVKLKQDLSSKSKVIQLKSLKYWIWNILLQAHEPSLGWYNTCLFLKIIISEIYIDENKNVYFWKGKI